MRNGNYNCWCRRRDFAPIKREITRIQGNHAVSRIGGRLFWLKIAIKKRLKGARKDGQKLHFQQTHSVRFQVKTLKRQNEHSMNSSAWWVVWKPTWAIKTKGLRFDNRDCELETFRVKLASLKSRRRRMFLARKVLFSIFRIVTVVAAFFFVRRTEVYLWASRSAKSLTIEGGVLGASPRGVM